MYLEVGAGFFVSRPGSGFILNFVKDWKSDLFRDVLMQGSIGTFSGVKVLKALLMLS